MKNNSSDIRMDSIYIANALIEEISYDGKNGYVLVSYQIQDKDNNEFTQEIRLVVGPDTIIETQAGKCLELGNLYQGMLIDAQISNVMTASLPPQSLAFRIVVLPLEKASATVTDRVIQVDRQNGFFVTGDINNIYSQVRFIITPETTMIDRAGNPICMCNLRPGILVRVEHSLAMTFSIPPQTVAYTIQLL